MAVLSGPDLVLARAVDTAQVPGVVALAAHRQGVLYQGAFGRRALDEDAAMTLDTLFNIASMTKPVTAVAALQLIERRQLALDEPAATYLPAIADVQVLDGFDGDGTPRLRAPRATITVHHLLTHTAGFAYPVW